ncbi:MAG: Pterin-4-alpha-carbinolamine dehydratase [uncultured Friedmanniella sp.]|uniref:Putative pterin-4-alpha-carbinolamine dehydratase n=1 Tax=uncultured Friedmanniella sp. TaxID=335381 RepID=A0A6J4KY45_9ACTN|nr:4a-hydroxytetrahydrobiopterin dehydratase [uncultured Friedmanniella sp.]CAA9317478.1 MAG: Pterin-4-alpha-carbinolamine dehydratase [uncultured Friedmanniella sp.]
MTKLSGQQIADADLDGWVNLGGVLRTRVKTPDFAAGLALVNAIGAAAEQLDHHPDLELRFSHVDVQLLSHDAGGVTGRDIRLARRISALAAEAGLRTEAGGVTRLELALDSPDHRAVLPFWAAVLGLRDQAAEGVDDELRDPAGVLPPVWFQRSGDEEPRQRWHHDLWVDPADVQPRIDAAIAAGGSVVTDAAAPRFWVLADPEGNRVCLCTWQDRD